MKKIICTSLVTGCLTAAFAGPAVGAIGSGSGAVAAPRTGIPASAISKSAVTTQPAGGAAQPGVTTRTGGAAQTGVTTPADVTSQSGITTPSGVIGNQPVNNSPKDVSAQSTSTSNAPSAAGANNSAVSSGAGPLNHNGITTSVNPANNSPAAVNANFNGNIVVPDQAVTPSDRILLTTLGQGTRTALRLTPNGNLPVHFLIKNGTVTVVGTVPSAAQGQAVLSQVQQTPGVIGVVNDMHVAGALAPAVQPGATGSLLGTPTDRAFSAGDQTLLTTVQQTAAFQLGVTTTSQMPVHFTVQNGIVGVTGTVRSAQEKQALISSVQRTPGIVRVVDNVSVVTGDNTLAPTTSNGSAATSGSTINSGVLTPTGNQSPTFFPGTSNSSGF